MPPSIFQILLRCRNSGHNDSVTGHGKQCEQTALSFGLSSGRLAGAGRGALHGAAGDRIRPTWRRSGLAPLRWTRKRLRHFRVR